MKNFPVIIPERTMRHRDAGNTEYQLLPEQDGNIRHEGFKLYLQVLRRRKWCIILPFFIICPLLILVIFLEKPIFSSTSRILIEKTDQRILDIQEVLRQDGTDELFFLTEYQMIRNDENIEELVKLLRLDEKISDEKYGLEKWLSEIMAFPRQWIGAVKQKIKAYIVPASENSVSNVPDLSELRRRAAVAQVAQSLQVTPREGGKLVDLTITGEEPQAVAQQANLLAEIYIRKNLEKKREAATNAVVWLTQQTAGLKKQMYDAELSLQKFRERENFIAFDTDEKNNIILERLSRLNSEYNQAQATRSDLENRLNNIVALSKSDISNLEQVPLIVDRYIIDSIRELRRRYIELKDNLVDLSRKYKENHPVIITVKKQMDEIKRAIDSEFQKAIDTLRAEHRILRAKETSLAQELNSQKGKTLGLKNDMITYDALRRDVESSRNLYDAAVERLREIKLTEAAMTNNVKMVTRALVPLQPVPLQASKKMALGFLLSACIGVGLAFIREYFDSRFKAVDEVEPYLGIPFLGMVPHYAHPQASVYEPVMLHAPASLAAEAYRALRTRLQAVTPMPKMFIVTSAVPAEGKSTTTANLSIAFAQLGWNVLVVDADLRRPALHRYFGRPQSEDIYDWTQLLSKSSVQRYVGRPNREGFANILADGTAWQCLIQETSLSTLKLLTAGVSSRNPADLLNLRGMQSLLDEFREVFDLVIFDAPLVFSIPDVEILAPKMDGVLLVHAPDKCEKESVANAKSLLERVNAKLFGVAFNNIRRKEEQYYSHQYHYYTYGNSNSPLISQGNRNVDNSNN